MFVDTIRALGDTTAARLSYAAVRGEYSRSGQKPSWVATLLSRRRMAWVLTGIQPCSGVKEGRSQRRRRWVEIWDLTPTPLDMLDLVFAPKSQIGNRWRMLLWKRPIAQDCCGQVMRAVLRKQGLWPAGQSGMLLPESGAASSIAGAGATRSVNCSPVAVGDYRLQFRHPAGRLWKRKPGATRCRRI